MTNDQNQTRRTYDLEERTAGFGEAMVMFARKIPHTPVLVPLIGQLVRAGTSVGADYCEADDAVSKREFRKNIGTCRKEARESKHWLRMLAAAVGEQAELTEEARTLWREGKALHLIFSRILRSSG